MGLRKYGGAPTARMQMYYLAARYHDLAVLDDSTGGHALFNYGHLGWTNQMPYPENLFSTQRSETDLVTGDNKPLFQAVDEILKQGYKSIFLMPSALSEVMGMDLVGNAAEIKEKTGAEVFTVRTKLNADYYAGAGQFYAALADQVSCAEGKRPFSYNILGGYQYADAINHTYIADLLETLSLELNVDVQNSTSFQHLKELPRAALNIVTNQFALKAAKQLERSCGTPYLYFNPFSPAEEHRLLACVAELMGKKYAAPAVDGIYQNLSAQLRNILAVTSPEIVCYADVDRLFWLEGFFNELGYDAAYLCSHKKAKYPYITPDEMISKYKDKLVLSSDRICRNIPNSIAIDESGLEYRIHLPLNDYTVGTDGAYRFIKQLGETLLAR